MQISYDIIIVGGGMVGATLACALAQQTSLSIAIIEAQSHAPAWTADEYHHRVSAIALSSQRIFQSLQVWDAIKNRRVSPFAQIEVWDGTGSGSIHFDSRDVASSVLGYIIENNVIQTALSEKLQQFPQISLLAPVTLTTMRETTDRIELETQDGTVISARLAVAADGAASWLREQAGINISKHDYQQHAIVAAVRTAQPHQRVARQVFLASGPLAFLPLAEHDLSSIVWSLPASEAKRLGEVDVTQFQQELVQAFSHRLGEMVEVGQRFFFPLYKQEAQAYLQSRVVLVGDAAHTVHPLAGQGVNIGLLDAASLAEVIIIAEKNRRDFAQHHVLRRYERWRKADNMAMLAGIDAIKGLFASDKKIVQNARDMGLSATNRMKWIKNIFTRHAVGNRSGLPELAL